MLRIKDIEFEVDRKRSNLSAYIPQQPQDPPERLCWSVEINCVEKEYEKGFWTPMLYVNDLNIDVRDWKQVEGVTIDKDDEDVAAYLYVLEHEPTRNNLIRFASRIGNVFTVEWTCLADAYWDDDYSSDLPLQLQSQVLFDGVHISWVEADQAGVALAKEMVARYLDLKHLEEPDVRGPHHIVFRPRW